MTRSSIIAKQLYIVAVDLKKYNSVALICKKNRDSLIKKLTLLTYLCKCVGMKELTDDKIYEITDKFKIIDIDVNNLTTELVSAESMSNFSKEYNTVISEMSDILSLCMQELCEKRVGYRKRVRSCILAFHNLPRAFLPISDRLKITPKEAIEYSNLYLEKKTV